MIPIALSRTSSIENLPMQWHARYTILHQVQFVHVIERPKKAPAPDSPDAHEADTAGNRLHISVDVLHNLHMVNCLWFQKFQVTTSKITASVHQGVFTSDLAAQFGTCMLIQLSALVGVKTNVLAGECGTFAIIGHGWGINYHFCWNFKLQLYQW